MFFIAKLVFNSVIVGLVGGVIAAGLVGLWLGIPLAFVDFSPGINNSADIIEQLKQFPGQLILAGFGGMAIGFLGGTASQLTAKRVNYVISTLVVAVFALTTIAWTHPHLTLQSNSNWGDYFESYRLTTLASLGGAVFVAAIGLLLRPFQKTQSVSKSR